jgi:DEAD/DEAH box helicase domain-containing protein
MATAPWFTATGVDAVLERWQASHVVKPCFTADETYERRDASFAPIPDGLAPSIANALRARGVAQLYAHQALAFERARSGGHFVVATPTASGKSLCFHLPVLQALHDDPDARALYLFPTKALARDQEASLRELMTEAGLGSRAVVFDGDTPADARRAARERSGIVLTNPDMLHTGILPHHATWARTFQSLRYVVVDELHTYKGVFGSHVANVLRRLLRVAHFHGSRPVVIGATATIGNPREHAARLFGVSPDDVALFDESGAPRGPRRVFLFNPPVVNADLGIRASYVKQAVMLAADLVRHRVPTLVFGQSRNNVEVMLRYLRDRVSDDVDASKIMAYRGGYLPEQRREIERKLRAGEVLGVVATNALELGIDIGALDAVICAGYPGSIAATWQRFGRAGRRFDKSVCVLVTCSAPLDQYLARAPDYLLGAPVEEARIDPDNVEVLVQHLKCAAFELPFKRGEGFGSLGGEETADAMGFLQKHGVVHESAGAFHWAADSYPANDVSLRSIGWDNVVIIDVARDESIAEMDWRGAHTMLHEQAIYQHDGECWQVERLDHENHKAFVRKVEPDYWTDAMTYTQISVLEESATGGVKSGRHTSGWGEVSVVEKVVGYKKIKFFTHENAGYGDVRLPEMQMHTTAFWLTVPEARMDAMGAPRAATIDALRGVGIALETVSTLALMCDPRDLGATLGDSAPADAAPAEQGEGESVSAPQAVPLPPAMKVRGGPRPGYSPTLFLYEHIPGGTGLAQRIFEQRDALLERALSLVESCPCASGCPACVGPCEESRDVKGRKALASDILRDAIGSTSSASRATAVVSG